VDKREFSGDNPVPTVEGEKTQKYFRFPLVIAVGEV
jgi:hypothetical protein